MRAIRGMAACLAALLLAGCASSPSEVVDRVLYDFGLGDKPEGYVEPSEQVKAKLDAVGQSELTRMNTAERHGEVKYQKLANLDGRYYKEVKVYQQYYPIEVQSVSKGSGGDRSYVGYIAYSYRIYQSERKRNRTDAAAASATIPTDETGRETYRYNFTSGGAWLGTKGERVRR